MMGFCMRAQRLAFLARAWVAGHLKGGRVEVEIVCHARVSVLLRLDGWDSEYSSSFSSCYHVAFAGGGNRK